MEQIDVAYFAARYSRNEEMRRYRHDLAQVGIEVSSRWIDQHSGDVLVSFPGERLNTDPEHCAHFAQIDLDDMAAADTIVNFTETGGGGKGGRHVEFGWAYAARKQLIVIGPRENVFHTLPTVRQFDTWEEFFGILRYRTHIETEGHAELRRQVGGSQ